MEGSLGTSQVKEDPVLRWRTYLPITDPLSNLCLAIIKQESGGNPKAVSGVGAKGLMQLMKATANECAYELGVMSPFDLFDPELNIKFGKHYIKKMLKICNGDVKLALASYHSGAGRVKRWQDAYGKTWEEIEAALAKKNASPVARKYVANITKTLKELNEQGA